MSEVARKNETCLPMKDDPDVPYAFIQWKGTDSCMDYYCLCGESFHIDGDFVYAVECPHCNRQYEVAWFVKLHPMTEPCEWHKPKIGDK